MSTADGEHHDRNRYDPKQVREPSGTARDAIDEFGVEMESTSRAGAGAPHLGRRPP